MLASLTFFLFTQEVKDVLKSSLADLTNKYQKEEERSEVPNIPPETQLDLFDTLMKSDSKSEPSQHSRFTRRRNRRDPENVEETPEVKANVPAVGVGQLSEKEPARPTYKKSIFKSRVAPVEEMKKEAVPPPPPE